MRSVDTLLSTVATLKRALAPKPPPPVRMLPNVFLTEDGLADWPGYEASNDVARRWAEVRGVALDIYQGIDPDMDGSEK